MPYRFKNSYFLPVFFAILLLAVSCKVKNKQALFTSPSDLVTDTIKTVYVVNDHGEVAASNKIKPADILAIRNLQNIEFGAVATVSAAIVNPSTSFLVEADGSVSLPVIGKVAVAGLNRLEAKERIQELYTKSSLKNPIIELSIINLKVTLLGEFQKQGNYMLEKEQTSLVEMIGEAGGISPKADPKTLKIIRGDLKNPEIIYVNLQNVNSLASPKLILQNNDIVYIQPTKASNFAERVQTVSTLIQPVLLVANTILIIYNLSR